MPKLKKFLTSNLWYFNICLLKCAKKTHYFLLLGASHQNARYFSYVLVNQVKCWPNDTVSKFLKWNQTIKHLNLKLNLPAVRGCSNTMSANNGGFPTPHPPSALCLPNTEIDSPPCHSKSVTGSPLLPPSEIIFYQPKIINKKTMTKKYAFKKPIYIKSKKKKTRSTYFFFYYGMDPAIIKIFLSNWRLLIQV